MENTALGKLETGESIETGKNLSLVIVEDVETGNLRVIVIVSYCSSIHLRYVSSVRAVDV